MVDTRHAWADRGQVFAVSTAALVWLKRMINEGRLNDLPDEHLLDIKNRRFLPTVCEYPITPGADQAPGQVAGRTAGGVTDERRAGR